jgi:hypothetical protein
MTNFFKKLNVDTLMQLNEQEMKQVEEYADAIMKMIEEARAKQQAWIKVDGDLYGQKDLFKFYLMKDLLKRDLFVESLGLMPAAGFKVGWCDNDILDIHRKRRVQRLEDQIPCNKKLKTLNEPFPEFIVVAPN